MRSFLDIRSILATKIHAVARRRLLDSSPGQRRPAMVSAVELRRYAPPLCLLLAFMLGGSNCFTISPPPEPEQFVVAYTRPSGGTYRLETSLSIDGTAWSNPSVVSDAAGTPVAVHSSGPPPGLATDGHVYQITWYDSNGILNSMYSSDGKNWMGGSTHGSPQPVSNQSRPTLAVGDGNWFAATRLNSGSVIIQPLQSSFPFISLTDGTTSPAGSLQTSEAPAIAYGAGKFVLAYLDVPSGTLRTISSPDGQRWPTGPGAPMPFPVGLSPGSTQSLTDMDGAPYVTFGTDDAFHLATTRSVLVRPGGTLYTGQIIVLHSLDGVAWTFNPPGDLLSGSSGPVGLGIAGPATGQVIVEPVPFSGTIPDVFANGARIDPSPLNTGIVLFTAVSLAHGPRRIDIRNLLITFDRFKHIPDPGINEGGRTEDVTLEVQHVDSSGAVVRTIDPWTVENATLRQQHFWSEGHGNDLPRFLSLVQPGDMVTVSVTGGDGTVSKELTFAEFVSGQACSHGQIDVDQPPQNFSYILYYSCRVVPQSAP